MGSGLSVELPRPIRVRRLTADGQLRVIYAGRLVGATPEALVVEAFWERPPLDLGYVLLEPQDRFVEYFFPGRWFVIYEIHHHRDDRLKGWYCDITYPPRVSEEEIEIRDLALDVFVTPTGEAQVLDEEEFEALRLSDRDPAAYEAARSALRDLLQMVERRDAPFRVPNDDLES